MVFEYISLPMFGLINKQILLIQTITSINMIKYCAILLKVPTRFFYLLDEK